MPTTSTANNYILKINQEYPIAGQDNDTQGFRDNFRNIKNSLTEIDSSLETLRQNTVNLNAPLTNFGNHVIEEATFKNCATEIIDNTPNVVSGTITVDYSLGNYQKYKLEAGYNTIVISNWPNDVTKPLSGNLTLEITTASNSSTFLTFETEGNGNILSYGDKLFPMQLNGSNKPYFFEIWNDSLNSNVYIKNLNFDLTTSTSINATATNITAFETLTIKNNIYSQGTYTGSLNMTVVENNGKYGNIALLPNVVETLFSNDEVDNPGDFVATKFGVTNPAGIKLGAKVSFSNTTTVSTVTNISNNIITVYPEYPVGGYDPNDSITFVNPEFTGQPNIVTFKPTAVSTTTGVFGDLKGQIYASSTTLYVAFSDYGDQENTWLEIPGKNAPGDTVDVEDNSNKLATTEFVHSVMPYGTILLWYGSSVTVPTGWALCDGNNGTPDLRGKFILAADDPYPVGQIGGSHDAVVVSHSHAGTAGGTQNISHSHDITDPGHTHEVPHEFTSGNTGNNIAGGTGGGFTDNTNSAQTGITIDTATIAVDFSNATVDVVTTGVSGTGANMPRYYALCYIMKTSGQ